MIQTINTKKSLIGTPRPHYLIGDAFYSLEAGEHVLRSKVFFPSDEEHPSILDRGPGKYLEHPHVNVGDGCFATWNGAHILSEILGYGFRILKDQGTWKVGRSPIVPNTELDLETRVKETRSVERNGKTYIEGTVTGKFSHHGEHKLTITSSYYAKK